MTHLFFFWKYHLICTSIQGPYRRRQRMLWAFGCTGDRVWQFLLITAEQCSGFRTLSIEQKSIFYSTQGRVVFSIKSKRNGIREISVCCCSSERDILYKCHLNPINAKKMLPFDFLNCTWPSEQRNEISFLLAMQMHPIGQKFRARMSMPELLDGRKVILCQLFDSFLKMFVGREQQLLRAIFKRGAVHCFELQAGET